MFVDGDTAKTIIQQHYQHVVNHTRCQIQSVSGGFSGANVFQVNDASISYCLRRWPIRQTHLPRVLAIHQLLSIAHRSGIDVVPVPLPAITGSTLVDYEGAYWQLEPWMPGLAEYFSAPTDERVRSAMSHLAKFHNAVRNWRPPVGASQWFQPADLAPSPTIVSRIRMIEDYEGLFAGIVAELALESDERFKELGSRIVSDFCIAKDSVLKDLQDVVSIPVPNQPCIRDVWHDHLLFTDNTLTGIVDFGAMATDSVTCDLSRMLGSVFGDDRLAWQRGISHYEVVRPLTESEHRLLKPLDRSSVLLSGMTWLKRRYILRNTPDDLSAICKRMESIAERLTVLAGNLIA